MKKLFLSALIVIGAWVFGGASMTNAGYINCTCYECGSVVGTETILDSSTCAAHCGEYFDAYDNSADSVLACDDTSYECTSDESCDTDAGETCVDNTCIGGAEDGSNACVTDDDCYGATCQSGTCISESSDDCLTGFGYDCETGGSTSTPTGVNLVNPIGTSDIRVIIGTIIKAAIGLSGSLALLMFIWGGFLWLTAAGNAERIDKGRQVLIWATIGLIVLFFAYTLVNFVITTITST